jgi:MFS transporter, YNFM family, putative membrane transport protein
MLLPTSCGQPSERGKAIFQTLRAHLKNRALCGAFAVGYLILFVFVGMFTYVNFRLGQLPFNMSAAFIGLIYVVFLPALLTTLAVGAAICRAGYRGALISGALLSLIGTGLTLTDRLAAMLLGLALVAMGLFFAQAVATAFTGYIAQGAKGTASGLYLAAYYAGGLSGAWAMGRIFDMFGWTGCAIAASVGCVLMMSIVGASWRPLKNIPDDPPLLRGPILLQRASRGLKIAQDA